MCVCVCVCVCVLLNVLRHVLNEAVGQGGVKMGEAGVV